MIIPSNTRKGQNQAADSLSRRVEVCFISTSIPSAEWWQTLQRKVLQDPFYTNLENRRASHNLVQHDGVWFYDKKVYLSPSSTLLPLILEDNHSSPTGGHFGFHKTLHRIGRSFVWPNMRRKVKEFLQTCEVCQQYKVDCMKPAGLL